MDLKVRGSLLFLMICFSVCDGSTTTITSSGSLVGKPGDLVSVNCTFPTTGGNLLFEYNGTDSSRLNTANGMETISVTAKSSTLTVEAVTIGLNSAATGVVVQLNFNLTANHTGSTLRCKFESILPNEDSESNFINLTVLYPPCCNVSSPVSENYNTTDPDPFMPLDCTEIVSSRGNLPATVEWTVSSSNPKCIEKRPECCDELYNISSISRECNGTTVQCMAKNDAEFTRKEFALAVNSIPGMPESCISAFIGRTQGSLVNFTWVEPIDNGGFLVEDYKLTVSVNDVIQQKMTQYLDNDMVKFSVSAVNVLGIGPECASSVHIPYSAFPGCSHTQIN